MHFFSSTTEESKQNSKDGLPESSTVGNGSSATKGSRGTVAAGGGGWELNVGKMWRGARIQLGKVHSTLAGRKWIARSDKTTTGASRFWVRTIFGGAILSITGWAFVMQKDRGMDDNSSDNGSSANIGCCTLSPHHGRADRSVQPRHQRTSSSRKTPLIVLLHCAAPPDAGSIGKVENQQFADKSANGIRTEGEQFGGSRQRARRPVWSIGNCTRPANDHQHWQHDCIAAWANMRLDGMIATAMPTNAFSPIFLDVQYF